GLAAAVTNNLIGVSSASWNPRFMAVNTSATTDQFIAYGYEGLLYAIDNGASIVNMSWGGPGVSQGVLMIAAAGNEGSQVQQYPGAFPGVFAVVNTNWSTGPDTKRFSSSYGTWVGFSSPGSDLYCTVDTNPSGGYAFMTGTSMAAPLAAGVAALIKAQ